MWGFFAYLICVRYWAFRKAGGIYGNQMTPMLEKAVASAGEGVQSLGRKAATGLDKNPLYSKGPAETKA